VQSIRRVIVADPNEISDDLNNYFVKIFTEEDITTVPDDPIFDTNKQVPICDML